MKYLLSIGCVLSALSLQGFAQESDQESYVASPARIIGNVADGKPAQKVEQSDPDFQVLQEKAVIEGGREVTYKHVKAPVSLTSFPVPVSPQPSEPDSSNQQNLPSYFVHVSATTYDKKATFVKLRYASPDGEEFHTEAWSNIDWNYLSGFSAFEGREQKFSFMMFHGNASIQELQKQHEGKADDVIPTIPDNLPDLAESTPLYLIVQGNDTSEVTLEFLEAIHDLYEAEQATLIDAHQKRAFYQKQREEELRRNPPKPKDIKIHFWTEDEKK